MWSKIISRRSRNRAAVSVGQTMLDEAFLRRLERLSLNASRMLRGGISGGHPSMRRLPAPTFSDHRSYSKSDDLRYVDWNAYGRQEELFVKLGETEQDVPVHVLLDRSRSMEYGVGDTHKLHYGRLLLTALGYLALAGGDKLTAGAFDTKLGPTFGPFQSRAHALRLLQYSATITPNGESRLSDVLTQYIRPRTGGLLVVISDLWSAGDVEQLVRVVQTPRWQLLMIHLLHRDELEPQMQGEIELEDSELGEQIAVNVDDQTINHYKQRVNQWCGAVEAACERRGAVYARVTTDMPLERVVVPFLRQRQVLQG
jgi:uncharacterized protein (DUF58 family)